jgi:hypothetical protein
MPKEVTMKPFSKPLSIALLLFFIWLVSTVFAGEGSGAQQPQKIPVDPEHLSVVGFIFGYFLTYSIRHGSKTQDVFKGFLGLTGAIGGTAGLVYVFKDSNDAAKALVSYGWGTAYGFGLYLLIALVLAVLYSWNYRYEKEKPATGWALGAETLGKILLGEDMRPPLSK